LNGLNQLFVYADDVDLIGDDIETLQSNTDVLVKACDEIGLQVNLEKTQYILSRNIGNNGNRYITIKNEKINNLNIWKHITSINEVT